MPNRVRRNSVVDMIARVPVNRGSLLKSIENLLKTIESSENAVMIPTLLRDKVRVDAWELLFVAKILKASILGHSDLVEFYMNHIGHSSMGQQQATTPNGSAMNGGGATQPPDACLSPSLTRGQSSPLLTRSPSGGQQQQQQQQHHHEAGGHHQQVGGSSASSINSSSMNTASTGATTPNQTSRNSTASWITASQQQQQQQHQTLSSISGASLSSPSSSSSSSSSSNNAPPDMSQQQQQQQQADLLDSPGLEGPPTIASSTSTSSNTNTTTAAAAASSIGVSRLPPTGELSAMEAARPLLMRQAQPPSLLQLTTTNNHINSMHSSANHFNNSSLELLTNQLTAIATSNSASSSHSLNGLANLNLNVNENNNNNNTQHLSISTAPGAVGELGAATPTTPTGGRQQSGAELRTSRSSGCLFRANSGASSPRTPAQTPTTPYPQAETLDALNGQSGALLGDPSSPVKLLLQIEQLKVSIKHVTTLLENVVELYKNSVDNIAQ